MKRIVMIALGVLLAPVVASPMASGQTTVSNLPPTIDSFIGDVTATEGQPKTYTINASDPDNTSLDYSLSVVSGDAAVVFGGNTATPTVRFHFPGTVVLRASVSDGVNPAVTQDKTVKVVPINPPANTAPSLSLPGDVTVEATSAAGAVVNYNASASDSEDGPLTPTCSLASGSTFALGSTPVNCSVTDSGSLSDSGTFTVKVEDSTAPDISGVPQDITEEATGPNGAQVRWQAPTANDVVDANVDVECSPASGTTFALGSTTVSCTATDAAGNSTTKTFKVNVTYDWSGVLQPVNADGSSIFKLGSTVPVKFAFIGGSAGLTDASAKLTFRKIENGIAGSVVEAASTSAATTGNLFRYDATSGQYVFNWGTKGLEQGTYKLSINLGDGTAEDPQAKNHVLVSLKK